MIENARLLQGHPMIYEVIKDKKTQQPVLDDNGQPKRSMYINIGVPKNPGVDWKQESWGQIMVAEANKWFPNGETGIAAFSWKVEDGDSTDLNTNMKRNCDKPGFPGHWIIKLSTTWAVPCYHPGKYTEIDAIQDKNTIKRGDYCRVVVDCVGNNVNGPQEKPGLFVNPRLFELTRPGEAIQGDGPSAAAWFGGGAPAAQAPAAQAPAAQAPASTGVTPAPDILSTAPAAPAAPAAPPVEKKYVHPDGQVYTESQLQAANWTPEQIAALQVAP